MRIYNVSFYGTFTGEARITAKSEEEAYEIASDLSDYFDINTTTYNCDLDGCVNEVTIESIEESEEDWEDDEDY